MSETLELANSIVDAVQVSRDGADVLVEFSHGDDNRMVEINMAPDEAFELAEGLIAAASEIMGRGTYMNGTQTDG